MSNDDAFWDKAFNDDTLGDLKPWKKLGKDEPTAIALLIDGDIIAYRAAAPCDGKGYAIIAKSTKAVLAEERYKKDIMKVWYQGEYEHGVHEVIPTKNPEPEFYAIYNIDKIMQPIIEKYPGAWVQLYLTGNTNFRTQIYDDYKANRATSERPVHLSACKQYLLNKYNGIMKEFHEADDLMGIEAMRLRSQGRKYLICSIDKDLNCIPGGHYNFVKDVEYETTEEESMIHYYSQCLQGDKVDNIPGIHGIGPKKAEKILKGATTPAECYCRVVEAWAKSMPKAKPKEVIETVRLSAELLWILQEEGVMWTPPIDDAVLIKALEEDDDVQSKTV
jgi:hypothetical protein